MMLHFTSKLTFLVIVIACGKIWCACRDSYMMFCDDLTDLKDYNVENWTELVVGSESKNSQLYSIDFDTISLDRFEKLTTLIIVNQIRDIMPYTFSLDSDDTKLEYVKLYGNDIKRLGHNTIDEFYLKKLSLVNNNIEHIHEGAFYNCEIEAIDLSNNRLKSVEQNVFNGKYLMNSTTEIVLRFNRLESIQPMSFPNRLEILNLDYNNLEVLENNLLDNLEKLKEFTVSHNKLKNLPSVKNLKEIRILDFSHNLIVEVNTKYFNDLTTLEIIDFSYNRINTPTIFLSFQFPQRHPSLQISLAFNRLTHLIVGNDSFRDHFVFLYGNPWNCYCWKILERFMVNNKVKRNKCDLEFFASGQTPYCLDDPENYCNNTLPRNSQLSKNDLQGFLNLVETSKKHVRCKLSPKPL